MTARYELRPPDLLNLEGVETGRDHLSHSSIGTFLACQQKWNWSREQRLEPAVTATPLAVGRAFADALEHGNPLFGERVLRDQAAAEAERASGNPWITEPSDGEVEVQAAIVREAARCYLARYGTHGVTRELSMRVRVRNPEVGGRVSTSVDLVGRVDAVSNDGRILFEDKLRSRIDRRLLPAQLRLDRQVTIGCYLLWRTTGIAPAEVRYRVTRKPGIKQTKKETFEQYLARIAEEYATKPDDYLYEEIVSRDLDDFLRLEKELWCWSEQLRVARASGVFPRNPDSCDRYGGCSYLPLCAQEPGAEHQFVERAPRSEPNKVDEREANQRSAA